MTQKSCEELREQVEELNAIGISKAIKIEELRGIIGKMRRKLEDAKVLINSPIEISDLDVLVGVMDKVNEALALGEGEE